MAARLSTLAIVTLASTVGACSDDTASSPPVDGGAGQGGAAGNSGTAGSGGAGGSSGTAAGSSGSGGSAGGASGGTGAASGASGASGTAGGGSGGRAGDGGTQPRCPSEVPSGNPVPAGATVQPVQGGYKFLEGPVWFAGRGVLLFSDMDFGAGGSENVPPSIIYELRPPNTIAPFITQVGSNGLAVDPQERLIACTHDQRSVSRFDLGTKQRSTVVDTYMGMKFSSPNDAVVRSDGIIYFTDPTWQLGNRLREITQFKGVFRVLPGGTAQLVSDDVGSPNGIALSPDEATLYVTDDGNGTVQRFPVAADGSTGAMTKVADVPGADGMAVDCAGNLFVTAHEGIRVLGPAGTPIATISVPQKPNNCTFGGTDRKTLYVAGRDTLYAITLTVEGLP
jgi:gluconolactonase